MKQQRCCRRVSGRGLFTAEKTPFFLECPVSGHLCWNCCGYIWFPGGHSLRIEVTHRERHSREMMRAWSPMALLSRWGRTSPRVMALRTLSLDVMESPFVSSGLSCVPVTCEGSLWLGSVGPCPLHWVSLDGHLLFLSSTSSVYTPHRCTRRIR